jgi:hypothetical protein
MALGSISKGARAQASAPEGAGGGNASTVQSILSTLSPEQQALVQKAMSDPVVLEAIDRITEILMPEAEAPKAPGASGGADASGGEDASEAPDEMLFGPNPSKKKLAKDTSKVKG